MIKIGAASIDWRDKPRLIHWRLILVLCGIVLIGLINLYSASNGHIQPWAFKQFMRFIIGLVLLFSVALIEPRFWLKLSYIIYGVAFVLLVVVQIHGTVGMGAQRWISIGFIQIQPSEIMKIALIMALARYFHSVSQEDISRTTLLIIPALMVAVPALLVLKQPDLGTALVLLLAGAALFFVVGVGMSRFLIVLSAAAAGFPFVWRMLHEYQRQRLVTFLNPNRDPLGAGYHITQSKIALGSGGFWGKGFMHGTQSRLNFLPEKQTDFIFTMFAEEWGMIGGLVLLALYIMVIYYSYEIALNNRSQYGKLVTLGISITFFLYFFINIAMVMGLLPVVGVPLPLISYGGTSMLSLMFGFGLIMSAHIHRDIPIGRHVD